MKINFENSPHPVDTYCGMAFMTIINLLLLSADVVELNSFLLRQDAIRPGIRLSGYFLWEYTESSFLVWQRMEYGCPECFPGKIIELPFQAIIKSSPRVN